MGAESRCAAVDARAARGEMLGLRGGEVGCRQNRQGKSKHKVHQSRLQGLSMKFADADG